MAEREGETWCDILPNQACIVHAAIGLRLKGVNEIRGER